MVAPQLRLVTDCAGSRAVVIPSRQQPVGESQQRTVSIQSQLAVSEPDAVIDTVVDRIWLRLQSDLSARVPTPERDAGCQGQVADIICRIGNASRKRQVPV
ncbi:MAG: hypothetical protein D8M59_15135 [Planctomycetes bacterium]|nr:hypothetical protein [Planctomycetota bacterium]NOG52815.1 hypothetical protein [Planctomycetota bacterium]